MFTKQILRLIFLNVFLNFQNRKNVNHSSPKITHPNAFHSRFPLISMSARWNQLFCGSIKNQVSLPRTTSSIQLIISMLLNTNHSIKLVENVFAGDKIESWNPSRYNHVFLLITAGTNHSQLLLQIISITARSKRFCYQKLATGVQT